MNRFSKSADVCARPEVAPTTGTGWVRMAARVLAACGALVLASCVDSKPESPDAPPQPPPAYKKPVRMTGRGEITSISFEKFFELHQNGQVLLYDARPAYFFSKGHIPGATNLPKDDCDPWIHAHEASIKAALAEGKTIVVYCTNRLCPDARTVARHISGFGHPASIYGAGWETWQEAGLPVE